MPVKGSINQQSNVLLHERAVKLAMIPEVLPDANEFLSILRFSIDDKMYAFEYQQVAEVALLPAITVLPGVPAFISGIFNLRGRILALLDLRAIIGSPPMPQADKSNAIILRSAETEFGVLVDSIGGISTLLRSDIHVFLPAQGDYQSEYFSGYSSDGMILLNASRLLSDSSLVVDQNVGRMA